MTVVGDWVEQVRETLGGGVVEQVNRLNADYTPGDQSLTLRYEPEGITKGVPVCVGLNTFMVWQVTPSSNEIEVSGSWQGSPDEAAVTGDIVRVKPNFYTHRILDAINQTINELSSPMVGMYGVAVQDITYDASITVYDLVLCEDIQNVLRVQVGDPTDNTDEWRELDQFDWEFRRTEPTSDFPSGYQLRVFPTNIDNGDSLRVIYARSFVTADDLDDDVTNTFIPLEAWDIPMLGAASRLAIPQEFRRNLLNAQPDSRRASEVPAGASLGGARALRALYQQRVEQETARLLAFYPPKRH